MLCNSGEFSRIHHDIIYRHYVILGKKTPHFLCFVYAFVFDWNLPAYINVFYNDVTRNI